MADPITIIGTAGAVANIIDVVAKTIKKIREFAAEYKEADVRFVSLMTQLASLRAALGMILEWMTSQVNEPHYQLIMDLEMALSCCKMLIGKIDSTMAPLSQDPGGNLDRSSKIKLVLESKDIDGVQRLIDQQTSALTLLLTACNCKTLSDQKGILELSSTRTVIRRLEIDTASLIVHRSQDSIFTRFTDNLSKLSAVFDFDEELFRSNVYDRALRKAMKEATRVSKAQSLSRNYTVGIYGNNARVTNSFISHLKTTNGGFIKSDYESTFKGYIVKDFVINSTKALMNDIQRLGLRPRTPIDPPGLWDQLRDYVQNGNAVFPPEATLQKSIIDLWAYTNSLDGRDLPIWRVLTQQGPPIFSSSDLSRIFATDYVASPEDVFRCAGFNTTLQKGDERVSIIDLQNDELVGRRVMQNSLGNVVTVVYVAAVDPFITWEIAAPALAAEFLKIIATWSAKRYPPSVVVFLRDQIHPSRGADNLIQMFHKINDHNDNGRLHLDVRAVDLKDPSNLQILFDTIDEAYFRNLKRLYSAFTSSETDGQESPTLGEG